MGQTVAPGCIRRLKGRLAGCWIPMMAPATELTTGTFWRRKIGLKHLILDQGFRANGEPKRIPPWAKRGPSANRTEGLFGVCCAVVYHGKSPERSPLCPAPLAQDTAAASGRGAISGYSPNGRAKMPRKKKTRTAKMSVPTRDTVE